MKTKLPVIAAVSGVHLILIGPPGTGKSSLLRSFASWTGRRSLCLSFHSATPPSVVEGRVHIGALVEGRWIMAREGSLADPGIEIAVCDELPRASEAVWDPLLPILERPRPLILATGNWFPDDQRADALMDRIGLWVWWDPPATPGLIRGVLRQIAESKTGPSRHLAEMGAIFRTPEWDRWSPDLVWEIRTSWIPTPRAQEAIEREAESFLNFVQMRGHGEFEPRARQIAIWTRILVGASMLFAGTNDFEAVPTEAKEALRWAWPATDRDVLRKWDELVLSWANPAKTTLLGALAQVRAAVEEALRTPPPKRAQRFAEAARLVQDLRQSILATVGEENAARFYERAFQYLQSAQTGVPFQMEEEW